MDMPTHAPTLTTQPQSPAPQNALIHSLALSHSWAPRTHTNTRHSRCTPHLARRGSEPFSLARRRQHRTLDTLDTSSGSQGYIAACCLLPAACCLPLAACLPAARCLPACRSLPAACRSLPAARCLPAAACCCCPIPTEVRWQPSYCPKGLVTPVPPVCFVCSAVRVPPRKEAAPPPESHCPLPTPCPAPHGAHRRVNCPVGPGRLPSTGS